MNVEKSRLHEGCFFPPTYFLSPFAGMNQLLCLHLSKVEVVIGVHFMNMYNTCQDLSCYFRLQILPDIILAGASKTSCGVQNPNKTENPLTLLMEPLDMHSTEPVMFHKQIEMTLRR